MASKVDIINRDEWERRCTENGISGWRSSLGYASLMLIVEGELMALTPKAPAAAEPKAASKYQQ